MEIKVAMYEMGIMEFWMDGDYITVIHWFTKQNARTFPHPSLQDLLAWKHTFLS